MLRVKKGRGLLAYETDRPLMHFEGVSGDGFPGIGMVIDGNVVSEIPDGSTFETKDDGTLFTRISGEWIRRELFPELAATISLGSEILGELKRIRIASEIVIGKSTENLVE